MTSPSHDVPAVIEALRAVGLPVVEDWIEPTDPPSHYVQLRQPGGYVVDLIHDDQRGWTFIYQPSATRFYTAAYVLPEAADAERLAGMVVEAIERHTAPMRRVGNVS